MVQCGAMRWNVLLCVAVRCSLVVQSGGVVWCSVVQSGAVWCSVLLCAAVRCGEVSHPIITTRVVCLYACMYP